ncbi:hypothetical protein D9615_009373 [Tricholomella constricta]|uniref:Uncharacterized protein n=1 Tax=Tricholomella constricta TaxID=117010 RepID=A0A8H5H2Q5_9AGAR|nr:hypothetical protein D9615_009373 [Tricholomella constricta]
MSLLSFVCSEAVGYATTFRHRFDDLQKVGLWPSAQFIDKITEINVWCTGRPNAIEVTYRLTNDNKPAIKLHGDRIGKRSGYAVDENEYFVGMFGAVDEGDQGAFRRIGFLVYRKDTGAFSARGVLLYYQGSDTNARLTPRPGETGPYPPGPVSGKGVKGFASLGVIKAFSGSLSDASRLETLAVYKTYHQSKPSVLVLGRRVFLLFNAALVRSLMMSFLARVFSSEDGYVAKVIAVRRRTADRESRFGIVASV